MVDVVLHCHNMGVMHRDLKPENFLLADSSPDAQVICTDFGLSTFFKEGEEFSDLVGSAYYVAPEVLQKKYGKQADLWSLGVIMFILLSGNPPFFGKDAHAIFQEILIKELDMEHTGPWTCISAPAKELVSRLLMRMTAQEVLNDPWVRPDGVATNMPIQSEVFKRLEAFAKQNKLKKEAFKIIASMLPEIEVKGLWELFKSFDADNSGHITVVELQEALKSKGFILPSQQLYYLISGFDMNKEKTIDYEEFIAATTHESKISREDQVFHAFPVLDTDNSGYIDPHELVDTNYDGKIYYEEFSQMMFASTAHTKRMQ